MQGLRPFVRYFDFAGRSGRAEYWQFFALCFIVSTFLWLVEMNAIMASAAMGITKLPLWSSIFGLLTFIPSAAVAFRRLHDRNKSGWLIGVFYALIAVGTLVFVIGAAQAESGGTSSVMPLGLAFIAVWLILGIYIFVQLALPGDDFENDYGPPDNEPVDLESLLATSRSAPRRAGAVQSRRSTQEDPLVRIERLAELHAKGHLTDEEFASQKARLLDNLE